MKPWPRQSRQYSTADAAGGRTNGAPTTPSPTTSPTPSRPFAVPYPPPTSPQKKRRRSTAVGTARPLRRRPAPTAVSILQGVCPAGNPPLHRTCSIGPQSVGELEYLPMIVTKKCLYISMWHTYSYQFGRSKSFGSAHARRKQRFSPRPGGRRPDANQTQPPAAPDLGRHPARGADRRLGTGHGREHREGDHRTADSQAERQSEAPSRAPITAASGSTRCPAGVATAASPAKGRTWSASQVKRRLRAHAWHPTIP